MAQKIRKVAPGIRKRGNTYEFNVSAGYDGAGKHIRHYGTFTAPEGVSETKADRLAMEAYVEFSCKARGNKSFGENMRFNQLCEIYFREYAPNKLKRVTIEHYKSNVRNHIAPVFGNRKLKDIETSDVSAFLTGLKCKPLTANKIKIVFHSILKYAVSQKYIDNNPCSGAIWKESTEREYGKIENVLNLQQSQKLMLLLEEYSAFNTIVKLLLLTGMRSGECLGLRWSSINFDNKTIFIDKTLSYAENEWFLSVPKTERSTRTIAIDDKAIEILKKHKEEQDKQKEIVGAAWHHPELVFTSCTGHWYDRSLLNAQFRRFVNKHREELKLEHNLTIHGLRHTNAALLLFSGESIENISAHLGHASSDITSRVYAHMYAEVKVRMAKTVSSALFG
ncbi:MAG: site-specific integrase [Clostridia bacterium]|nr:site-specific integrase [Clostridia bacterium]